MGMVRTKRKPKLLEPGETLVVTPVVRRVSEAMPIEQGTIGVDYTPPPKTNHIQAIAHNCDNCQGVVLRGVEKCPTCEGLLDWSGIDN